MKLKLRLTDDETRRIWETAQKARKEVESWPAWKRGEDVKQAEESSSSSEPDRHAEAKGKS